MSDRAGTKAIGRAAIQGSSGPTLARGAVAGRLALLVGILVVVFGVVLPRLVDVDAVKAAIEALTPLQLGLLGVASATAYVASAGPSRVLLPDLSWPRAVGSDLAARAVVSTVPGPTDAATRFVLYRQWSIPAESSSAAIALAGLLETLACFAMPLIAVPGLIGLADPIRSQSLVIAVIGLVVLVAAAVLLVSVVRSDGTARRLGQWLDRMATRGAKLLHRTPPSGIAEGVLELRERSKAMLTSRGRRAFAAAVVGKLAWFVVLEVALWSVGVGPAMVAPAAVLAAMAVVGVVSLVPVTPGAVGVAEVLYVGILSSVAVPGIAGQLTAAVSVFRIAQWLVPIPIGWLLLLVMRRGHAADLLGSADAPSAPAG